MIEDDSRDWDWVSPADDRSDSTAAFMEYACTLGAMDMPSVFGPRFDPWEEACRFSTPPFEDLVTAAAAAAEVLVAVAIDAEIRGGVEKPECLGVCWEGGA